MGPAEYDYSQVIKGTLDWCNERRVERGKDPLDDLPKGRRGDPASCPCGRATGLLVRSTYYDDRNVDGVFRYVGPLPAAVQVFTQRFDRGHLPEYDESLLGEGQ